VVRSEALQKFPTGAGIADWVAFADHVAVVRAVSETTISPPKEIADAGEGMVGRAIRMELVDTLWVRPGSSRMLADDFELRTFGWALRGEQLVPLQLVGAVRVEVGETYVAPLVWDDGSWGVLSLSAVLRLQNDLIEVDSAGNDPSLASLNGLSVPGVSQTLDSIEPEPILQQIQGLSGTERVEPVLQARLEAASD
jgi:hypothetical protein